MKQTRSLRLKMKFGVLKFEWSDEGRLCRIAIDDLRSEGLADGIADQKLFRIPKAQVPGAWYEWFLKFREYLLKGEPLGEIPWEFLEPSACTDFQKEVYRAIAQIPHGETRTYSWVAEKIRKAGANQAVGQALRNNPFPVLIPCHRVVAKKGGVGGFMGKNDSSQPEVNLKERLIQLEDRYRNPEFPFVANFSFG